MTYFDLAIHQLNTNHLVQSSVIPDLQWQSVHSGQLPVHGEKVLLSVEGILYQCVFNSTARRFNLKDEPNSFFSVEDRDEMNWISMD
jgi:hypothetical protein